MDRMKAVRKPGVVCFLGLDEPGIAPTLRDAAEQVMASKIPNEIFPVQKKRGVVRGLYCGGTLCAEAELIFRRKGLAGHQFIDLGADEYTRGRPHPMIEPEIRNDHVRRALADPAVAVILVDVVLGYGAHDNPAAVLLQNDIRNKTVVACVTGTEQDPQGWSRQAALLRRAGVLVAPSNAHAAELAASIVS
jgi:FdrA protein